ncbi:MAG: hypothetical protein CTY20_05560 [Hyphomicrobium sp.]|nr:MAG: hypothetical protein CTY20_05560 [Hyphomicrobium sp.]
MALGRFGFAVLALAASAAAPSGAVAADCGAEVAAAFERQRKTPAFRLVADTKGDQGLVKMQIDYVPPDRMHQTVTHPNHTAPLETIAIGRWAWGTMGAGWEELQPQFAQSVTAFTKQTLVDPIPSDSSFECLGKVAFEGKDYVAYRTKSTADAAAAGGSTAIARTVYVDPASGLPMLNVVADVKPGTEPLFKGIFSYPADLRIEAPLGDPNPK